MAEHEKDHDGSVEAHGEDHALGLAVEDAIAEPDAGELRLDEEALRRREQALAEIVQFGDPVLKSRASEVTDFGDGLEQEVRRMVSIMHDAIGVGLAATQVGLLRRFLVFQTNADAEPRALVNPEIEWLSEDTDVTDEGCLSIPRVLVEVERPLHARVTAVDEHGEPMLIEASGHEARVLQHEIDHLNGVLMLDRAERSQRRAAMRALRQGESYSPHPDPPDPDPETGAGDG